MGLWDPASLISIQHLELSSFQFSKGFHIAMGVAQYLDGSTKTMEFGFNAWLVVWNMAFIVRNVIIPTDFHIYQRG